jgi:hypothetical protein
MATSHNLEIEIGLPFSKVFYIKNEDGSPKDLTDCVCSSQIRPNPFTEEIIATPYITVSDAPAGKITLFLDITESSMVSKTTIGHYDIKAVCGSEVLSLAHGRAIFKPFIEAVMTQNLEVHQATTWSKTYNIMDHDGSPRNLTGYTVIFKLKHGRNGALVDVSPMLTVIPNPAKITISIDQAQMSNLYAGMLYYEIVAYKFGVEAIKLIHGNYHVTAEITRSTTSTTSTTTITTPTSTTTSTTTSAASNIANGLVSYYELANEQDIFDRANLFNTGDVTYDSVLTGLNLLKSDIGAIFTYPFGQGLISDMGAHKTNNASFSVWGWAKGAVNGATFVKQDDPDNNNSDIDYKVVFDTSTGVHVILAYIQSTEGLVRISLPASILMNTGERLYFWVIWYDHLSNTFGLRVNENELTTSGFTRPISGNPRPDNRIFVLGYHSVVKLDEVGVMDRAIAPSERAWLYNSGAGNFIYPID